MDATELLMEYESALVVEAEEIRAMDRALSAAYLSGAIDGKNAEMRKAQEFQVLEGFRENAECATIARKVIEAHIQLERARLYSLSGS